jgi:hypothetical protein
MPTRVSRELDLLTISATVVVDPPALQKFHVSPKFLEAVSFISAMRRLIRTCRLSRSSATSPNYDQ